jgi:hypothetical protein
MSLGPTGFATSSLSHLTRGQPGQALAARSIRGLNRFLVTGDPITPELIEHIVNHILSPRRFDRPVSQATGKGSPTPP